MRVITQEEIETRYNNKVLVISYDNWKNKHKIPNRLLYEAHLALVKDWGVTTDGNDSFYMIVKDRWFGANDSFCLLETEMKKRIKEFFTDFDLTIN